MIHDAYRFLIPVLVLAAVCFYAGLTVGAILLLLCAAFIAYFFRNPVRHVPAGENLIVSPADGRVVAVADVPEGDHELPGGKRISIFLNIFNVHVNRVPMKGELKGLEYKRGKFKVAYDEEASRVNEQNVLTIQGERHRIIVKQIAGLIARRVVCWKRPGQSLARGELFGLIRFGSRVDVLLPKEIRISVKAGDSVKGGTSIIGEIN